jgi:NAD(P)-dependent dehydrogenase (short-subunit alcohol dehydrogenase family)
MTTNERGLVIVTGASSGIGEAIALHLREGGFAVLAGVRRDEDAERLRTRGLTPIRLDVTDPEQLAAARAQIGDRPLAGLVNNAGILRGGPLEFVPIDDLREQLEVNVVGQMAVTQAFIGGLRAGRGRIVNVGSISARLASPMIGPYVAAKFALEGLTDTLRRELALQGIDVIMIEPGGVNTPLIGRTSQWIEQLYGGSPPELAQRYGAMLTVMLEQTNKIDRQTGIDASAVAKVVDKALTVRRPRTRYLVGRDAIIQATMAKLLPDRLVDRLLLSLIKSLCPAYPATSRPMTPNWQLQPVDTEAAHRRPDDHTS